MIEKINAPLKLLALNPLNNIHCVDSFEAFDIYEGKHELLVDFVHPSLSGQQKLFEAAVEAYFEE